MARRASGCTITIGRVFLGMTAGFVDTKDLSQRAAACMACHVGPNSTTGQLQVVDHDLIAAGHPRLSFEFHAYFESLPAHWDRKSDEARQTQDFHFRLWAAGQLAMAEQRKLLPANGRPDFAQLDCYACHHQLGDQLWRQVHGTPLLTEKQVSIALPSLPGSVIPVEQRLSEVRTIWDRALNDDPRFDAAVDAYLASRALLADFGARRGRHWTKELPMRTLPWQRLANT